MKPLPTLPLTPEDIGIWVYVGYRFPELPHYTPGWLRMSTRESDRRDAALMYKAQVWDSMCYMCCDAPGAEMVLVR